MGERYKRTIYFIVKTFMAITCIFPLGYFLLEYIDLHTHAPWFGETSGWDTCYTILSTILGVLLVIEIIEFLLLSVYLARYLATRYGKTPVCLESVFSFFGACILFRVTYNLSPKESLLALLILEVCAVIIVGILSLIDKNKNKKH